MKLNFNQISYSILCLCFAMLFVGCKSEVNKKETFTLNEKPNVILIMVDDQGYGDVASLGNKE